MICKTCELSTKRLHASEWHQMADRYSLSLADIIQSVLTPNVTEFLPPHWQGEFTEKPIPKWIVERDAEGAILLLVEITTATPIGFLTLFESTDNGSSGPTVRLGYVISEPYWGRGIATELVRGFLGWAGSNGIERIISGVDTRNVSSTRVLEKCGFKSMASNKDEKPGEAFFEFYLSGE